MVLTALTLLQHLKNLQLNDQNRSTQGSNLRGSLPGSTVLNYLGVGIKTQLSTLLIALQINRRGWCFWGLLPHSNDEAC